MPYCKARTLKTEDQRGPASSSVTCETKVGNSPSHFSSALRDLIIPPNHYALVSIFSAALAAFLSAFHASIFAFISVSGMTSSIFSGILLKGS